MDFYSEITKILTEINSNAVAYYLEKSRFELETLNMTVPAVNVYPTISGVVTFTKSLELQNVTKLEVVFLSQDEWDNSDYNALETSKGTAQICDTMRILANTVFFKLRKIEGVTINDVKFDNQIRVNSNTMSGVLITASITYKDTKVCNYEL